MLWGLRDGTWVGVWEREFLGWCLFLMGVHVTAVEIERRTQSDYDLLEDIT